MTDSGRTQATPKKREPKTQRGRDTRDDILKAARILVSERWVDDVPFTELAATAQVARASLLHVYPHWRNVLYDLFAEEIDRLDRNYEAALALKRATPGDRAYAMLAPLLDRAEQAGRLYPNLRSAMFTWQADSRDQALSEDVWSGPETPLVLSGFLRIQLSDHFAAVEQLLQVPREPSLQPNEFPPNPIGECLVNFALDLAARSPTYFESFDERREMLRTTIDVIAAGIATRKRRGSKKRRRTPRSP